MIRHTVVFKLKHAPASPEERAFLEAARGLAAIPVVHDFQCCRQTSKKNIYHFGLSMDFENQQNYQTYNQHPDHVAFVQNRWLKEVTDFMEIDYEPID